MTATTLQEIDVASTCRKWPKYPSYNAMQEAWLDKPPAHWDTKRLKHAVALVNSKQVAAESDLPYVGMENIESGTGRYLANGESEQVADGLSNSFRAGDVLFGKLRPYLAKALDASFDGLCSSELLVFRSRLFVPQYLLYLLLTDGFVRVVDSSTYGAKMPRASWEFIGNLRVPLPPVDEQRAIAAFLDCETARIDELIAKKQRCIELLLQKKASTVEQIVLGRQHAGKLSQHPEAWFSALPENWEVKRLKFVMTFLNNRRIPLSAVERGGMERLYPYYGASGIIDYVDDYLFDEPLILVAEDGANLYSRSTPLAFVACGRYWVNNHAHILRPRIGPIAFWEAVLQLVQYDPWISGSAQPKLTKENLGSIPLPVPPPEEITEIASRIAGVEATVGPAVDRVAKAIDRLRRLRSAVVSAAVTGQIDVRQYGKEAT